MFKSCFLWRGRNLQKNILNKKTLILYYCSFIHSTSDPATHYPYQVDLRFFETPIKRRHKQCPFRQTCIPEYKWLPCERQKCTESPGRVVKLGEGMSAKVETNELVCVVLPCPKYNKGGKYSFLMCFKYQVYISLISGIF